MQSVSYLPTNATLSQSSTTQDKVSQESSKANGTGPLRDFPSVASPRPGAILMCDFAGYRDDEIGPKYRPVIVVAAPVHSDCSIVTVVPISQASRRANIADVFIDASAYPCFNQDREHWAKVRLVAHVSIKRLDRIQIGGRFTTISLDPQDLDRVLAALRWLFSTDETPPDVTSWRCGYDALRSLAVAG